MAKKDKLNKVLFSDNITELFIEGAKITLLTMIVSVITMWLVSIFTNQILNISMGTMIVLSTGIAVSFGAVKIYEMTLKQLKD
jgi:spore maturation protein SpmB